MGAMKPEGVRSVAQLVKAVEAGAKPKYVLFWGHRPGKDGSLGVSCFSQWWPAPFSVDGETFASAEHYMMWRKALLFDDSDSATAVLRAHSPAKAKEIGRTVRGFDEQRWREHRWDIVVTGSTAKFGSDPALREFLLSTGKRVLVEASPVDRVWGIGLAQDSEFAEMPQRWRGLNLLGFALMEARARLAKG